MAGELSGRVALVTGAGRGIGRALAFGLAEAGASIALVARTQNQIDAVAAEVREAGGTAVALGADVGDAEQLQALAARTVAALGPVSILINNAAVVTPLGPTSGLDPAAVTAALAVNVTAIVTLSGTVLPGMLDAGWGRIVNVSSAIVAFPGAMVGMNTYAATKAAVETSTINLAAEVAGTGVTVNAYRPGAVDTAMQEWIRGQSPDAIGAALHERFSASHAEGNLITPERSAAVLLSRLVGDATGEIWDVSDDMATTAERRAHAG